MAAASASRERQHGVQAPQQLAGPAGGRKLLRLRRTLSQGAIFVLLCACRLSWQQDVGGCREAGCDGVTAVAPEATMQGAGVCRKLQAQCRSALRWACLLCGQRCVLGLFSGKEKGRGVELCVGCQVLTGSQQSDTKGSHSGQGRAAADFARLFALPAFKASWFHKARVAVPTQPPPSILV